MLNADPSPPMSSPWTGMPGTPTVENALRYELEQARERRFRSRNRSRERKQADRLIKEVEAFVSRRGIDRIGFLTLTMKQGATWQEMMDAFGKAVPFLERTFLKERVRVAA